MPMQLETEAAAVLPHRPADAWPRDGAVIFTGVALSQTLFVHLQCHVTDYQARYRPGLDLVLHGITAEIRPREKVRTSIRLSGWP